MASARRHSPHPLAERSADPLFETLLPQWAPALPSPSSTLFERSMSALVSTFRDSISAPSAGGLVDPLLHADDDVARMLADIDASGPLAAAAAADALAPADAHVPSVPPSSIPSASLGLSAGVLHADRQMHAQAADAHPDLAASASPAAGTPGSMCGFVAEAREGRAAPGSDPSQSQHRKQPPQTDRTTMRMRSTPPQTESVSSQRTQAALPIAASRRTPHPRQSPASAAVDAPSARAAPSVSKTKSMQQNTSRRTVKPSAEPSESADADAVPAFATLPAQASASAPAATTARPPTLAISPLDVAHGLSANTISNAPHEQPVFSPTTQSLFIFAKNQIDSHPLLQNQAGQKQRQTSIDESPTASQLLTKIETSKPPPSALDATLADLGWPTPTYPSADLDLLAAPNPALDYIVGTFLDSMDSMIPNAAAPLSFMEMLNQKLPQHKTQPSAAAEQAHPTPASARSAISYHDDMLVLGVDDQKSLSATTAQPPTQPSAARRHSLTIASTAPLANVGASALTPLSAVTSTANHIILPQNMSASTAAIASLGQHGIPIAGMHLPTPDLSPSTIPSVTISHPSATLHPSHQHGLASSGFDSQLSIHITTNSPSLGDAPDMQMFRAFSANFSDTMTSHGDGSPQTHSVSVQQALQDRSRSNMDRLTVAPNFSKSINQFQSKHHREALLSANDAYMLSSGYSANLDATSLSAPLSHPTLPYVPLSVTAMASQIMSDAHASTLAQWQQQKMHADSRASKRPTKHNKRRAGHDAVDHSTISGKDVVLSDSSPDGSTGAFETASPDLARFGGSHACTFPNCGKKYESLLALHSHVLSHNVGANGRPARANGSPQINYTTSPASMSYLLMMANGGNAAQIADSTAVSSSSANKPKPFKCDQCPHTFSRSHDLKRHYYVHSQDRPFLCRRCHKGFSRRDALKRHQRAVLEGKKVHCAPADSDMPMFTLEEIEAES